MAQARKKILCIEDDRETAKLIAEELSERGFSAVVAYDGRVGLAAILKRIPDLVLCDVGLPEMSGFELLVRLSGRDNELRGRSVGADDYVTKPIDFDILEAIIRTRLIGGVARHEISAKLPKLNDRRAQVFPRSALGKTSSSGAVREQIVELIDAPTVDFHLEKASGTTDRTEAEVKAVLGRVIKP
jgi:DNA-binding response OmpR family regulator